MLLRMTLLLSVVAFLQGYMVSSAHFMVNHMDVAFRVNQRSSNMAHIKGQYRHFNEDQNDGSFSSTLSTSIVSNFYYVYASDTYPQVEVQTGAPSTPTHLQQQEEEERIRTHEFSTFARGFIMCLLLGQAVGSALAWKLTDSLGRWVCASGPLLLSSALSGV